VPSHRLRTYKRKKNDISIELEKAAKELLSPRARLQSLPSLLLRFDLLFLVLHFLLFFLFLVFLLNLFLS